MASIGKCMVCMCASAHILKLRCGHTHCRDCISRNIQVSIDQPPFHPVHCCRKEDFTMNIIRDNASDPVFELYKEKLEEYETADKLYCWKQACSAFIPHGRRLDGVGRCPKCEARTCVRCTTEAHDGECTELAQIIEDDQKLLRLVSEKSWQRCPQCRAVVSKTDGCNHINCRCGGNFCYLCGRESCICNRKFLIRQRVRRRRGFIRRLLGRLL